ncbi:uncharacterized protein [Nicotiana tomentosiformis]|uniref:uncharacterized protein n=1 Tax=Nicotiana tomentosiformis TaxID=4098 RepID=UPI00388CC678
MGSSVDDDEFSSGIVIHLMKSVVKESHAELNSTSLTWDWRNKYIDYLNTGKLPSDSKEWTAMHTNVAKFSLSEGTLFRRTFDGPFAICLGMGDTEYVLREVHEGTCGNNSGVESLVQKLIIAGYYWINMEEDVKDFVRRRNGYQRHAPIIHQPGELLHSVLSSWPFMKWGMDIVGPLP